MMLRDLLKYNISPFAFFLNKRIFSILIIFFFEKSMSRYIYFNSQGNTEEEECEIHFVTVTK